MIFEPLYCYSDNTICYSIVAVPPVGAHPIKAWTNGSSPKPWLISDLRRYIPNARVLLYNHGMPTDGDTLDSLGRTLLDQLLKQRETTSNRRPLFFICHSTGGLVTKSVIVRAGRSRSNQTYSILTNCYGIAFLSTPHHGSTYLSSMEYAKAIQHLMKLCRPFPQSLQICFRPRQEELTHLSTKFKSISSDMSIWTFLETVDSIVYAEDPETNDAIEFHVPITSVRSGMLGLEHEKQIPLATDHSGTATFRNQEYPKIAFLNELAKATKTAVVLSQKPDFPLDPERDAMIQIHGFFEDSALGVSYDSPMKLWSTKNSLREYLAKGPAECLRVRMQSTSIQLDPDEDSSLSSFEMPRPPIQSLNTVPTTREQQQAQNERRGSTPSKSNSKKGSRPRINTKTLRRLIPRHDQNQSSKTQQQQASSPSSPPPTSFVPRINILGGGSQEDEENPAKYIDDSANPRLSIASISSQGSKKNQTFLPLPISTRSKSHGPEPGEVPKHAPAFDRPEPGTEKLMWIHVPYTHAGWVPEVLAKAGDGSNENLYIHVCPLV